MLDLFNYKKNANILVVGDTLLDTYWHTDIDRISPEAPVPIAKYKKVEHKIAGAGLIANIIKNLKIADNVDTLSELEDINNTDINKLVINNRIRIVSQSKQILRVDDINNKTGIYNNELFIEKFKNLFKNYNTIIFYDYFNNQENQNLKNLLKLCRENNIKTILAPDKLYDTNNYLADHIIRSNIIDENINSNKLYNIVQNKIGMHEMYVAVYSLNILNNNIDNNIKVVKKLSNIAANYASKQFGQCIIDNAELQLEYADYILEQKYNYHSLKQEIKIAREKGQKIVFANGCFDVLHIGHIAYLEQAKQHGDKLFVAINSDCSIKRIKGPSRPINNLSDRLEVLKSFEFVDWIVPFFTDTPSVFIEWLKPDVLVKGGDYTEAEIVGREIVHSYGGKTAIINHGYNNISSTKLINQNKTESMS